ncbi:hypothetical protein COOONC_07063 [Cooperia oncophora]
MANSVIYFLNGSILAHTEGILNLAQISHVIFVAEVKQSEDLDVSASWFVSLASSLLSTTSENYIQYKNICFEMIDLLVSCKSKVAYTEWSRLYKLEEMKMAWHIPTERGKAVIEEILKKFLFPVMDEIMAAQMDRLVFSRFIISQLTF